MPAPPPKDTSHVAEALALEPSQLAGKVNWEALLTVLVNRYQSLENVMQDVMNLRTLEEILPQVLPATNVHYDGIGKIVGWQRPVGTSDLDYRAQLRVKILVNRSRGYGDTLLNILNLITSTTLVTPPSDVQFIPEYPAAFIMMFVVQNPVSSQLASVIKTFINKARAGGVLNNGIIQAVKPYFGFSEDPNASAYDVGKWADLL